MSLFAIVLKKLIYLSSADGLSDPNNRRFFITRKGILKISEQKQPTKRAKELQPRV